MNYIFFWKPQDKHGIFSQWYIAPIMIDKITYQHCEQYMMAQKALLFGDRKIYEEIMLEENPSKCKKLGQKVSNFNEEIWNNNKFDIVYKGNYAKFSQHKELQSKLLATGNAVLVEASPYDKIWGIGFNEIEALSNTSYWGENLLGKVIMKVREELGKEK